MVVLPCAVICPVLVKSPAVAVTPSVVPAPMVSALLSAFAESVMPSVEVR